MKKMPITVSIFLLFAATMMSASCDYSIGQGGEDCRSAALGGLVLASCAPPSEEWSLAMCEPGSLGCDKQYYVVFYVGNREMPIYNNGCGVIPVMLTSGEIMLGDYNGNNCSNWIDVNIPYTSDVFVRWSESIEGHLVDIVCTGRVSGEKMSGECTQKSLLSGFTTTNAWTAEKGLIDVENGSFEKDIATGKTRLYFRSLAEEASRIYITADFIDGWVDLIKCGKTRPNMDIWKISADPACSSEGYYEFPSVSDPLVVKTHIVKPTGESVREKTVTHGTEVNRPGQIVDFSTIDTDLNSGVASFRTALIQDSPSWDVLWAEHKKNWIPAPDLPAVDFSQNMLIGVFLGSRPNGCYSVSITSVSMVDGQKLVVTYHENTPPENVACTDAMTFPSHIVSVRRSDLPVEFLER